MRKVVLLAAVVGMFSLAASAQEFYSEGGFGVGKGWTLLNGSTYDFEVVNRDVSDLAVEVGIKVGYGPFGGMPLYFVGELEGMGHRFSFTNSISGRKGYYQYNTYLIGPGFLYYPMPRFQLAASVGYSFTSDLSDRINENSLGNGIGYNASAAVELGSESHGVLIGVKFFNAHNFFSQSIALIDRDYHQNSMFIGAFMRYTFWRRGY